jgi:hypothetical protein
MYIWIAVIIALSLIALISAKIGIDLDSPAGDILFFGGTIILGIDIICFLFKVLFAT